MLTPAVGDGDGRQDTCTSCQTRYGLPGSRRPIVGVYSVNSSRWGPVRRMSQEKRAVSVILFDAATGAYGKTQNPQGQADQYPFD